MNRFMVHDKAMDVFIEVLSDYKLPSYRKVKVSWWNLGFSGQPWELFTQRIEIQDRDWLQWKYFNPNQPDTHPGRK